MVVLGLELYGFTLSMIGFGLSGTAYMIANRVKEPLYFFNNVTLAISLLGIASMIIGLGFL